MKQKFKALLIIIEITGNTKFIQNTDIAKKHAQTNNNHLIETIIQKAVAPLSVAKTEENTAHIYVAAKEIEDYNQLQNSIYDLTTEFKKALLSLEINTTCSCSSCQNISKLNLRTIVHSGTIATHSLGHEVQLTGKDVIAINRLRSNTIENKTYILYTDQAKQEMGPNIELHESFESYDQIGSIITHTHTFGEPFLSKRKKHESFMKRIKGYALKALQKA